MKPTTTAILLTATLLGRAIAHGLLRSPTPRMPGKAMASACGQQVYNNQASDPYGNIQSALQVASSQPDYTPQKCNLNLCKAYQFADANASTIQTFTPGQVVPMVFDIRAPHTGVANVSVVDTALNKPIGAPLISWTTFASVQSPIPQSELSFQVTMPDLGSRCGVAGACVVQHWWDAASINQTYESCVDFVMKGGSASSAPAASSSSAVASVGPTTLVTSVREAASSVVASSLGATPTAASASREEGGDGECEEEPEQGEAGDDEECEEEPESADTGDEGCDEE